MRALLALSLLVLAAPALIAPSLAQDLTLAANDTETTGDGFITLKPGQIGEIFCISRIGNDMAPVTGLLTSSLTDVIADAEARDDAWAKANPGEKPPLGDGIPWQAWQDYAPECTVGDVTLMMDEARVQLSYAFPDAPDANFVDTLLLKLVDDPEVGAKVWRIDDVAYATEGDLRTALVSAFMD